MVKLIFYQLWMIIREEYQFIPSGIKLKSLQILGIMQQGLKGFQKKKIESYTDNGTEFKNRVFQEYYEENGIKHEVTNTYTPKENDVADVSIRQ